MEDIAEEGFTLTDAAIVSSREALALLGTEAGSITSMSDAYGIMEAFFNDPAQVSLTSTQTSLTTDTDTSPPILIANILIENDGLCTNTISLAGTDASLFEIDGTQLHLIAAAEMDFETNAKLDVRWQWVGYLSFF